MMVYAGHVGGERALRELHRYGMGRLVATPTWRNPIPGLRWCLDNGAFQRGGTGFDEDAFVAAFCDEMGEEGKIDLGVWNHGGWFPDFAIVPDIPFGGRESLDFSLNWVERLDTRFRWLLAVQDGMSEEDVAEAWDLSEELGLPLRGIFVGGSIPFKLRTTEPVWVPFAHERGGICHVGRVGTLQRLVWAERIGVDSVDSSVFGLAFAYARVKAARSQSILSSFSGDAPSASV